MMSGMTFITEDMTLEVFAITQSQRAALLWDRKFVIG